MQAQPTFSIDWLGLLALALVILVVVRLLANGNSRALGFLLLGLAALPLGAWLFYMARSDKPRPLGENYSVAEIRTREASSVAEISTSTIPLEVAQAVSEDHDHEHAAEPKPSWVEQPPGRQGDDYFTTATAGPHATRELCDRDLAVEVRRVTEEYIDKLVSDEGAGRLVELPPSYLQRQIVQEEWQEPVQASFGPMVKVHALLKFDKQAQDLFVQEYRSALVQARVATTAGGAALVLVVLGSLFGYLKLDTMTRGYYSGRLKLATGAVIATAAAAAVFAIRELPM